MRWAVALLLAVTCSCSQPQQPDGERWQPPVGSNIVFDVVPGAAPGKQLIVADLRLEANAVGQAHFHPWEEYLYVIEGSALLELPNSEPKTISPGETYVIPAETVHKPRAGPAGVRAIVTRLHNAGDPISVEASE